MIDDVTVILCDHIGEERVERIRSGYLGDNPAGTKETLCSACGFTLEPETV